MKKSVLLAALLAAFALTACGQKEEAAAPAEAPAAAAPAATEAPAAAPAATEAPAPAATEAPAAALLLNQQNSNALRQGRYTCGDQQKTALGRFFFRLCISISGHGQRGFVAHLLERKAGANFLNPRNRGQLVQYEPFERGHIGNGHADQVIAVTGHEVALHHLVVFCDAALKIRQCRLRLLLQTDGDKYVQTQPQGLRVCQSDVLAYDPLFFEGSHPHQTR